MPTSTAAWPSPSGPGTGCVGVIELFSREIRERDAGVYALTEGSVSRCASSSRRCGSSEEREEARLQLEAILRGVADAVTAQAPDGRLLFANDAAVEMLGFDSAEALMTAPLASIMGRYDILDDDGEPFPLEALPGRRALAGEDNAETVVRFRVRETGEERWSAVKATPIRDHDGNVTMAINVIEDITTHKRAELGAALPGPERRGPRLGRSTPTSCSSRSRTSPCPSWRTGARSRWPPTAACSSARRSRTSIRPSASARST